MVQTNIQPKVGNVTAKPKVSTIMEDQISEEVTREPVILKEKECQESTKIEEINSPEDPSKIFFNTLLSFNAQKY